LKSEHEVAVIDFVPTEVMLESGLQHSKDLAVHIILGYAKQKKSAYDPPIMTDPAGCHLYVL
jgi:hypothetical protein